MSNGLVWRRCPACGQLTLVPATANVCWQCGAPHAGHRPRRDADGITPASNPPADGPIPGVGPGLAFGLPRGQEPSWSVHRAGGDRTVPVRRSSAGALTEAERAIADRLLASVFSDGVEV